MEKVIDHMGDIVEGRDHPRDGLLAAENLAVFAVRELTGERRALALALAGALADYCALDADKWPDLQRQEDSK